MNLVSLLHERASLHPDRAALVEFGTSRSITYAALSDRVSRGAAALQRWGLQPGDTILVFQPVSIPLYEFILAAMHAGMKVMLADPTAGEEFLGKCCERLMPDALFGPVGAQLMRCTVRRMWKIRVAIRSSGWWPFSKRWNPKDAPAALAEVDDAHPALITFTSGSTGVPKATVRTHGFLLAQHRVLADSLEFKEGEIDLTTLPVFVLANLASGMTSVLVPQSLDPVPFSEIVRSKASRCAASPAFFEGLLKQGLPPFDKMFLGGAPVHADLLKRLWRHRPTARITAVYGSTEAEPIAHAEANQLDSETEAIAIAGGGLLAGKLVPGIELRILQDQWGTPFGPFDDRGLDDLTVSNGQAGEIVVSGDHVLTGYLHGIGDAETKIHANGRIWHRTGDAGWIDAEGRLWLLGRCGEKLPPCPAPPGLPEEALRYPFAIECGMRWGNPDLRVAAIGWKDKRVLVTAGAANGPMQLAIRNMAADQFGIERVIWMDFLPYDHRHRAKIDYPALRQMLGWYDRAD